jgi:hypothetical protein
VKVGFAIEGGVGGLRDEEVVRTVDTRLEVIPGLAWLERRTGVLRVVPDENNRLPAFPPVREKSTNVVFAGGVVSRAKGWVVETVLDVNHNQGVGHDNTVSR